MCCGFYALDVYLRNVDCFHVVSVFSKVSHPLFWIALMFKLFICPVAEGFFVFVFPIFFIILQLMKACSWPLLIRCIKLEILSRHWNTAMLFMRETHSVLIIFFCWVQSIIRLLENFSIWLLTLLDCILFFLPLLGGFSYIISCVHGAPLSLSLPFSFYLDYLYKKNDCIIIPSLVP